MNKAFLNGLMGSYEVVYETSLHDMRMIWEDCKTIWSILDSKEAHFVYVGMWLLCVGMIKLGMYARDCWEESKIDEEPGTVEVMSSPTPEQVVKRVAVRYCREFREFVTRLNKVTKREIMIAHHAWSIVWNEK